MAVMPTVHVPASLHNRLGHDATNDLLELVASTHDKLRDEFMIAITDRFERRMAEHLSEFRAAMVKELHDSRVEIIKWVFVFWVGQMTALVGVFALLFRAVGR
jgi:hypothetical protein